MVTSRTCHHPRLNDPPAQVLRLISLTYLSILTCEQQRFWLDCAYMQADQILRRSYTPDCTISHGMATFTAALHVA